MTLCGDSAIERLVLRVMDCSLPKEEWTHEGHFAAALWLLRNRRELTTPSEIRKLIMRYNEATNTANTDTGGYHHTITLASMRAANHYLYSHSMGTPLHGVLRSLMASPHGRPDWFLSYWSRNVLFSVAARRGWIEPDTAALPF